jgi:plasmid stabilization system protein ParE
MTYKIKYLPLAVQDLNEIARYLSGFYPKTASRVLKELREKITKLGDIPKMCEVYRLDRLIVGWSLTSIWCSIASKMKTRLWRFTVCCEVLGICRSIWNKFNFDCCERYRKPPTDYHHCGDSLPGVL